MAEIPAPGSACPGPGRPAVALWSRLSLLFALYFVQGLPFGFQATALPAILRSHGMSLAGIGLLSVLSLPWILKVLWSPLVDRLGCRRFGRRKSWIVPLQVALAITCLAAVLAPPDSALSLLLALVLLMNFFAATLDIAVDGLAVDMLGPAELGYGNAIQVVGYKVGMLTGGGLLLWATPFLGWEGIVAGMAALTVLVLLTTLPFQESAVAWRQDSAAVADSLVTILRRLLHACRRPGGGWLLLFVASYKAGETMADTMYRPFLVDLGITLPTIGLWLGTYGMLFSLLGSLAGGWLASRLPLWRALGITAGLRVIPLIGQWALAAGWLPPTASAIVIVTCGESFFGGALTTATFAFMMSQVDRRIGATHFTALASVEVLGKILAATLSGVCAELLGYGGLFATAVALSAALLALLPPLRPRPVL